jgi:TRAP-type C4-dicarboxylate transport system permease small subunit
MFRRLDLTLDTIAALAIIAMCLLIVTNVISRELLQIGVPDLIILVRELMVPAILFPLTRATANRAHVAIEFLAQHFPDGLNRWIAVFAALLGLLTAVMLLIAGGLEFWNTFRSGAEYPGEFAIPKWPSRAMFVLAMAFFVMRLFQIFWIDLLAAATGRPAPETL